MNESRWWSGPRPEEEKAREGLEESIGMVGLGRGGWNGAEGCLADGVEKLHEETALSHQSREAGAGAGA